MWAAGVMVMSLLTADLAGSEPPAVGLRAPGYYLHVAPGAVTFLVPKVEYFGYLWGVSGGRLFPRPAGLMFAVGGFAEHLVITTPRRDPRDKDAFEGLYHFVRIGPEFRVGASNQRAFVYLLTRLGLDVLLAQPGGFFNVQGLFTIGPGVQGAVGPSRRMLLGVEPGFEISFPVPWPLVRARAFLGVRF